MMLREEEQCRLNGYPNSYQNGAISLIDAENLPSLVYGKHHSYDPSQRPLHVVVAGAGPSGIAMAIALMNLPNVTFKVFDKNPKVGGTWFENKYLGAACDVASHAYQYTFASNPNWSSHFSPAPEIFRYFEGVAEKFNVLQHVQLNSRIISAAFNEPTSKWRLCVSTADQKQDTEVEADVFINATGILNKWKWPDIAGLQNFAGPKLHTANWDTSWDWAGKRVAVIGSGATGIQVVPKLQPEAKSLEVYVRSPTYILPSVGFGVESSMFNEPCKSSLSTSQDESMADCGGADTEEEKRRFQTDKKHYREFRKAIEQQMNENFAGSIKNSKAQAEGRQWAENMMRKSIKSEELQNKLIPKWELGCRRLTPGKPYLDAVQQENVDIITSPIDCIVENGIKTMDGTIHHLDAIVCATGFDTSFTPAFELYGLKEQNLKRLWSESPAEAYMGLAVSGFPNYWTFLGPNTPIANGSLIPCIEWSAKYIVQALNKMQREQIKSMSIKKNIQDAFNQYTQAVHKDLVWTGSCRSWYKDNKTNKVTAVWPGSSIHFMDVVNIPRWEDYEIEYTSSNPFTFMGNGISAKEANKEDLTYYLNEM